MTPQERSEVTNKWTREQEVAVLILFGAIILAGITQAAAFDNRYVYLQEFFYQWLPPLIPAARTSIIDGVAISGGILELVSFGQVIRTMARRNP